MLDYTKLKGHVPENVYTELPAVIEKFQINTVERLSSFLGQCAHESGNFKVTSENLNYSADGLRKIFGKYFDANQAKIYERKPQAIAAKVYASRMGNGNENTKDGWTFRGRGYIQLTGKANYMAFGKNIIEDILVNPDVVSTKYPLLSAAWFWSNNGINKISDGGINENAITAVSKRVNGGTVGLQDRIDKTKLYYNILK